MSSTYRTAPARTVESNGVTYAYRELGPKGGVPVVFFVHLAATLDNWDPRIVDPIAANRHVITFDQPGVGASTGSVPSNVRRPVARYNSPVSRWAKPNRSATARATVPLPAAAGPSIATVNLIFRPVLLAPDFECFCRNTLFPGIARFYRPNHPNAARTRHILQIHDTFAAQILTSNDTVFHTPRPS